ncbi:MAG TPA: hypothetical protein VFQ53_27565 [Kofleriaceae bacterium]|nr:hypothetical protein [Kofleriaceae bacterium]
MSRVPTIAVLLLLVSCGSDKTAPPPSSSRPSSASPVAAKPAEPEVTPVASSEPTPDAIRALHKETFGGVTLGMTQAEVVEKLGAPRNKTKPTREEQLNGPQYFTTWTWPGIEARFGSVSTNGRFTLRSIKFRAPSHAKTARNVGVGSTRAEVMKAYADIADPVFAKDSRFFVAGMSAYPGLNGLEFTFDESPTAHERSPQTPEDTVKSMEAAGGAED